MPAPTRLEDQPASRVDLAASAARSGRSSSPWAKTPTVKACKKPRTASPGCTPRFSPASTRIPPSTSNKVCSPRSMTRWSSIKDIRFESTCEHHLLPFIGKAHVAYIPNGKVVGLSKIPRVIDVLSKRPQLAGAADRGGRRPPDEPARGQGGGRGDGGVAQLHDDPRASTSRAARSSPAPCEGPARTARPPAPRSWP